MIVDNDDRTDRFGRWFGLSVAAFDLFCLLVIKNCSTIFKVLNLHDVNFLMMLQFTLTVPGKHRVPDRLFHPAK